MLYKLLDKIREIQSYVPVCFHLFTTNGYICPVDYCVKGLSWFKSTIFDMLI